jgi:hypothetical protein
MGEHHWDPQPGDEGRIRAHLHRQRGVPPDRVRLDDGRLARVGELAAGEADPLPGTRIEPRLLDDDGPAR